MLSSPTPIEINCLFAPVPHTTMKCCGSSSIKSSMGQKRRLTQGISPGARTVKMLPAFALSSLLPCRLPKRERQHLSIGSIAQRWRTASAGPWQWQSQGQEQVEDACKNNGDLAVSWLEKEERQPSLFCILRIAFDSFAPKHLSCPGGNVLSPSTTSAGSHETVSPKAPTDCLHCGKRQHIQLP